MWGGCWCGAVRYRVADEFLYAWNCHCSRCRAATGSAFKSLAGIEREKLTIIAATHDRRVAVRAKRVVELRDGRVVDERAAQ